jgi:SEC-C motif-containing protein
MKNWQALQPCPCGRLEAHAPLAYQDCCGRWLEAGASAPDAESLMRSRYCAFVLAREAYLLGTWHPDTRPATVEFDAGSKWLGLEVRHHTLTGPDTAEVEFVARHKPTAGPAVRLHERSRFVKVPAQAAELSAGRWLYLEGVQF